MYLFLYIKKKGNKNIKSASKDEESDDGAIDDDSDGEVKSNRNSDGELDDGEVVIIPFNIPKDRLYMGGYFSLVLFYVLVQGHPLKSISLKFDIFFNF